MSKQSFAIAYDDILAAAQRLQGVAHRTPVITSTQMNNLANAEIFFKCEMFQHGGAFKFRGAYNGLCQLDDAQKQRGVVAFSSGNHAQAVAKSAKILGIPSIIIMPEDAPPIKAAATQGYGATIVTYNRFQQDREAIAASLAREKGLTLIPPFDHAHVMAGQGTAAKELFEEVGALDYLLVPIGGGGLIAGSAIAGSHLSPACRVVGVEPEAGNDAQQSFNAGKIVTIPVPQTIADGAQTTAVGRLTFPIIQNLVHDIVTVDDNELRQQMKFFAERMKIVVEPTGCLAAAALACKRIDVTGKRVGVILSGGNILMPSFII